MFFILSLGLRMKTIQKYNLVSHLRMILLIALALMTFQVVAAQNNVAYCSSDDWMTAPFSGDNTRYAALRLQIYKEISGAADYRAVVSKYRLSAQVWPSDPARIFSWGTACYYAKYMALSGDEGKSYVQEPYNALFSVRSPGTYDFVRLQFLFFTPSPSQDEKYIALGRRLLQVNGQDANVIRCTAFFDPNLPEAAKLAEQAVSISPKDPVGYWTLGILYSQGLYMKTKQDKYAILAISAFRTEMSLSNPRSDQYAFAKKQVEDTTNCLKTWHNGKLIVNPSPAKK
jgi:hypothetical protein